MGKDTVGPRLTELMNVDLTKLYFLTKVHYLFNLGLSYHFVGSLIVGRSSIMVGS